MLALTRTWTWLAALAVALTGCGGVAADDAATTTEDARAADEADLAPSPSATSPVTVVHRYGETTVTDVPERVVTVGLTDHDAVLALGTAPVGTTEWYGGHPHAVWPWATDALGDAEPDIVGTATELDYEKIAALEPDLILGLYSALTQEQYDTLAKIAPTVAQPADHVDYGIPWQELTVTVGKVLGQASEARALVADVEARFDELRRQHPEFAGANSIIATPYEGTWVYSPDVANARVLTALGFEFPAELAELVGEDDGATLSPERMDLLDVDALVWLDAQPGQGPLAEPLYQQLAVHREGREVVVDSATELGGAMSFSSVLSLPVVLDQLVPMLAAAVDGDADTKVPTP